MESKTPNFDAKMKAILDQVVPGPRICEESGETFEIRPEDLEFYKTMLVPPPKVAPWVRQRNLFANVPSDELFKGKSALSGKDIITDIEPGSPLTVYDDNEWWSDKWDAISYSQTYNPTRSFFEQWQELKIKVPRLAKAQHSAGLNINSEWAVGGRQLKNCYYSWGGGENENLCYATAALRSRDSLELFMTDQCELSYELFTCKNCYHSIYLENCDGCTDCQFGFDLKDCEHCFGCFNLRHKKFCFFNEQLTKEEYEVKIKKMDLGSHQQTHLWLDKFYDTLKQHAVRLHLDNKRTEGSLGDDLVECQNCHSCFNTYQSKNLAYTWRTVKTRDSQDLFGGIESEYTIGSLGRFTYNVKYCQETNHVSNLEYCDFCQHSENCFGCAGLRNKKFCILNRQYTEEEYWPLVDKIKCDMLERGEYGRFAEIQHALFPYNLSPAFKVFPLSKEEVKRQGGRWYAATTASPADGIDSTTLPDNIKDATTNIIGKPIICRESKRLFTIIKQEFEFYQKMNLPLPTLHPIIRRTKQWQKFRTPKLIQGHCHSCRKEIWIRGISEESQRIKNVCEDCYLKAIGYDVQNA